jgi:hypothetical protein
MHYEKRNDSWNSRVTRPFYSPGRHRDVAGSTPHYGCPAAGIGGVEIKKSPLLKISNGLLGASEIV